MAIWPRPLRLHPAAQSLIGGASPRRYVHPRDASTNYHLIASDPNLSLYRRLTDTSIDAINIGS